MATDMNSVDASVPAPAPAENAHFEDVSSTSGVNTTTANSTTTTPVVVHGDPTTAHVVVAPNNNTPPDMTNINSSNNNNNSSSSSSSSSHLQNNPNNVNNTPHAPPHPVAPQHILPIAAQAPTFTPGAPLVIQQPPHHQQQQQQPFPGDSPSASLYVGDLHPDVQEPQLCEVFQALGPVSSVRVCRDLVTRRSLGYAYVNFHNMQDAERALDTMNYHTTPLLKGRPMRIMWKARDPSARKQGQGNIYVKGLDKSIDNKCLFDTFSQFGKIMSCKVASDEVGNSLGYGFVHFESIESAETATASVNGMMLAGHKVYVGPFRNKRERETTGQATKAFTNIYCKNFDESICTQEKIRELFAPYGQITSVYVPVGDDGKPKGFAFINFESPDVAQKVTQEMDGMEIAGKAIFVGRAQKKMEREMELRSKYEAMKLERVQKLQGVNLYVKNLSDDIDDEKLRNEFVSFGTITSCKVMRDERGQSRGFGFVCFSQPEEATRAVTELNGRMIGLKPIYVALAQRKEARRLQLEQQRNMGSLRFGGGGMPGPSPAMYGQPNAYMFQQAGMSPQIAPGVGAGRGNPGFINPQYMAAMGRGVALGRGAPVNPSYIAAMGRGQPMNPAALNAANMAQYGMGSHRQPRQNRQRNSPMGGAPVGQGGVVGLGAGRGGPNGPTGQVPQQQFKYPANARGSDTGTGGSSAASGTSMSSAQGSVQVPNNVGHQRVATEADGSAPLTIEQLSAATPQQQKQLLGEKLYPLIGAREPTLAGKITGMLLEMENSDILHLIDTPEALHEQVDEALAVLRAHQQTSDQPGKAQAI